MLENILINVGFNKKESEVYLALLHAGTRPASFIANRIQYNRITTYQILVQLVKKGVVSITIRSNIKYFTAESPERILSFLEQKKQKAEEHINIISEQLPLFQKIVNPANVLPEVRTFSGLDGIISVYEETLELAEDVNIVHDVNSMNTELKDYVFKSYIPKRVKKEITCRLVLPMNEMNLKYGKFNSEELRKTRYVSFEKFSFDVAIFCYAKKVAIISYKQEEQFATIIDSLALFSTMKGLFEMLWGQGKEHV